MRFTSSTRVILVFLFSSLPLRTFADVSGSCVSATCTCPDGRSVTGGCNQDCAVVCGVNTGGGTPGGGYNPSQQMMMQGAQGVGAAIGSAFARWLTSPSAGSSAQQHEFDRMEEQQFWAYRQEQLQKQRQQQALTNEQAHQADEARKRHDQLMSNLKESGPEPALAVKNAEAEQTLTGLKNQVRAMNCAMAEVYQAAGTLGPEGTKINAALHQQLLQLYQELPTLDPGASRPFSVDHMQSGAKDDAQLVVKGHLYRDETNGDTKIDVQYSLSKAGREARSGQDKVILNSRGGVNCQQVTAAAAKCMAQFSPGSAAEDYCPQPPPDSLDQKTGKTGGRAIKAGGMEIKND